MKRTAVILALIIAGVLCTTFNASPTFTAEATENSGPSVDAVGSYFEVPNSTHAVSSSEIVHMILHCDPSRVTFIVESNSSATSTLLTLSGLEANTAHYRFQEGCLIEEFITDSNGEYTYTQDLNQVHDVSIQEDTSTLYIYSDYTFASDIYDQIVVMANNIVIDGNGYKLQGSGSGWGLYLPYGRSGVTIQNVEVTGWYFGIYLFYSQNNNITSNVIAANGPGGFGVGVGLYTNSHSNSISRNYIVNNPYGVSVFYSTNNLFCHNNFIDNAPYQGYDRNPAGNNWHHPGLLEGNYWSDYPGFDDGSGSGKHSIAGDGIGDTDIPWPGGSFCACDYYPFTCENGWVTITATVDIDPDTLNLKSNGEFATGYIQLPEGCDVSDILLETVCIEAIPAITDPQHGFVTDPASYLLDLDGDGIAETRMVKLDRAMLRDALTDLTDYEIGTKFYDLTLTVTGQLADGTKFQATDTIVVIKK